MNEVYVIAGGEWLRNNLNAIAAFMGTRTWDSIEKIALTLSVLAVAVMWVQRHNVMDLLGWVAVFVLISLLVNDCSTAFPFFPTPWMVRGIPPFRRHCRCHRT
ncbi:hypothetical protein G997_05000 [Escherichia coli UMEA 3834-1]|nr:hypothetical protein G997_05000 [Escherichia coli UMEA 3834-1]